jgi:murein DD-endopeptidase MepM/ murein hydrolase activator NlpD
MRRSTTDARGWSAGKASRLRRPRLGRPGTGRPALGRPSSGRRAILFLLLVATFGGFLTSANPRIASADSLSDAYARQTALQKLIARQKASIRTLTANQATLSSRISSTKRSLSQINANLLTVRTQIVSTTVEVAKSQNAVDELVATAGRLDAELVEIEAEEAAKATELNARKELLASRIREAYETDRTSVLETLLSGRDFTDVLTEVGYELDFAEQDRLLAEQIVLDQGVLDVLHENVVLARDQTAELHDLAAKAKKQLDHQMADLNAARKELVRLEEETRRLIAQQQSAYVQLSSDKAELAAQLAAAEKAQRQLEALIARLVAEQLRKGGIPSVYNGTFRWPMSGRITQEFGCTGFAWEPRIGNCAHFHRGIDIANTMYTPIYAAGPGKVIWSGRSPYDPAWIVIIAHSSHLVSWYGHIDNRAHPPVVRSGQYVAKGQLIAYEGMTGHTTGPHLHWAVQLNGTWVNPRLFLPR